MLWLFPTIIFPHTSNGFNSNKRSWIYSKFMYFTPSLLITITFNSIIHFSVTMINFQQFISTFIRKYTFYSILGFKIGFDLEIHFDLEIWPWPWKLTLTLKIDLDLEKWPWPSTPTLTFKFDLDLQLWPWPSTLTLKGLLYFWASTWALGYVLDCKHPCASNRQH